MKPRRGGGQAKPKTWGGGHKKNTRALPTSLRVVRLRPRGAAKGKTRPGKEGDRMVKKSLKLDKGRKHASSLRGGKIKKVASFDGKKISTREGTAARGIRRPSRSEH